MSLTATQLFSKIDRCCGTSVARYSLAEKALDINIAQDDVYTIALKHRGWNVDDFNHTADPIITTDIVSGQRDYHFTVDEQSNLILDFLKVQVADSSGVFHDLIPTDMQGDCPSTMTDGQDTGGTPTHYDKTGNGIFLDLVPDYNYTDGLRCFIDRQALAFASTDTTKISGIDGLCHDYLYLKPSYEFSRDNELKRTESLFRDLQVAMAKIEARYGNLEKDVRGRLKPNVEDNR